MRIKSITVAFFVFITVLFTFAACGKVTIDMKKITGSWTVNTIDDGYTPSEYAEQIGRSEIILLRNFNIKEDSLEMTIYDPSRSDTVTVKYDIEPKFNSFYIKEGDSIKGSYKYDADNDTISFVEDMAGNEVEFKLKRGTTDINALIDSGDDDSDDDDSDEDDKDEDE